MVLLAVGCAVKNSLTYTWLFECVHTDNKAAAVSAINVGDMAQVMLFGVYAMFVSNKQFAFMFAFYCLGIIAWLATYVLMTESPKWLLSQGQIQQAHASLKRIAEINGTEFTIPSTTGFIEQNTAG